jgi:hypothetical protein
MIGSDDPELYESTKAILREAQACVLNSRRGGGGLLDWLWRELWGPVKYVARGFGELELMRGFTKYFAIVLPLTLAFVMLLEGSGPEKQGVAARVVAPLIFLVPGLLTVFSLPSSYALAGVKGCYVESVAASVAARGRGPEYLGALRDNFEAIEKNAGQKISGFKFVVTGLWAWWWYSFWQSLKPVTVEVGGGARAAEGMTWLMLCFLGLGVAYLLAESYKKASEILFASIYFGINENRNSSPGTKPAGRIKTS